VLIGAEIARRASRQRVVTAVVRLEATLARRNADLAKRCGRRRGRTAAVDGVEQFAFRATDVCVHPISIADSVARSRLVLTGYIEQGGKSTAGTKIPLPASRLCAELTTESSVNVQARIPFSDMSRLLTQRVVGTVIGTGALSATITSVEVAGDQSDNSARVVLKVSFDGPLTSGWVYLVGSLEYSRCSYDLRAVNLTYDVTTSTPGVAGLIEGGLKSTIEENSRWPMAADIDNIRGYVSTNSERILAGAGTFELSQFEPTDIRAERDAFAIDLRGRGTFAE
jgi:hypothetical protein